MTKIVRPALSLAAVLVLAMGTAEAASATPGPSASAVADLIEKAEIAAVGESTPADAPSPVVQGWCDGRRGR